MSVTLGAWGLGGGGGEGGGKREGRETHACHAQGHPLLHATTWAMMAAEGRHHGPLKKTHKSKIGKVLSPLAN